jgi:hypothetical protein
VFRKQLSTSRLIIKHLRRRNINFGDERDLITAGTKIVYLIRRIFSLWTQRSKSWAVKTKTGSQLLGIKSTGTGPQVVANQQDHSELPNLSSSIRKVVESVEPTDLLTNWINSVTVRGFLSTEICKSLTVEMLELGKPGNNFCLYKILELLSRTFRLVRESTKGYVQKSIWCEFLTVRVAAFRETTI